jgi:hypothetical protein
VNTPSASLVSSARRRRAFATRTARVAATRVASADANERVRSNARAGGGGGARLSTLLSDSDSAPARTRSDATSLARVPRPRAARILAAAVTIASASASASHPSTTRRVLATTHVAASAAPRRIARATSSWHDPGGPTRSVTGTTATVFAAPSVLFRALFAGPTAGPTASFVDSGVVFFVFVAEEVFFFFARENAARRVGGESRRGVDAGVGGERPVRLRRRHVGARAGNGGGERSSLERRVVRGGA